MKAVLQTTGTGVQTDGRQRRCVMKGCQDILKKKYTLRDIASITYTYIQHFALQFWSAQIRSRL